MIITIQHTGYDADSRPLFTLNNGSMTTQPVALPDPDAVTVEGYGDKTFPQHLRWYLEEYLNLPYGPSRTRAEAVAAAMETWGTMVFDALFDRDTYQWYAPIRDGGRLNELQIRIVSKDPVILSWPWEALCDNRRPGQRRGFFLAPHCCLERLPEPSFTPAPPLAETERLRMLLVIARPHGEGDVGYHALARAVVDYVRAKTLPVEIDVLRPSTFDNLRETLRRAKEDGRPYHIVHFDGHGGYGVLPERADRSSRFQGSEGCLVFETEPEAGGGVQPHLVGAGQLGQVLFQCGVPMVVLNACQSAMVDKQAESAYASVAASLLDAGILSVTAMGYSLWVSGAKEFVPAFYRQLFRDGTPAGAMRAGREAMFTHNRRSSGAGLTELQDWIVPELYQRIPVGTRVLPVTRQTEYEPAALLDPADALKQDVGGFIGRGQAILELERLSRRDAAGVLIHGVAGAGKTTLAKGFLGWLRDTGGLRNEDGTPCRVFWYDFRNVFSGTFMVDELASKLFKDDASPTYEENLKRVVSALKRTRAFLVWDNMESASGAAGTSANLPEEERAHLKELLEQLRGGRTKVLITSRTSESWLTGDTERFCSRMKRDLDGLRGDELWEYCGKLMEELGLEIDKDVERKELAALQNKLDGNPLALRSVLLRLKDVGASELLPQLDRAFAGASGDESTRRIQAAFDVLMRGADEDMAPVLRVLGLHEHYADADYVVMILGNIARAKPDTPERQRITQTVNRCFDLLNSAGLCTHTGQNIHRMHPALRGCLAERYAPVEDEKRWFAIIMNHAENRCHNKEEQRRAFFSIHEANIRHVRELAERLELRDEELFLTVGLAVNADDRGDYGQEEALWFQLAEKARRYGDRREENRAYSRLSALAFKRGDKEAEKKWAQMAEDVWEDAEALDADVLVTKGNNAFSQGDYAAAMKYLEQAAVLWEQEDDPRAIGLYGLLGNVAGMIGDVAAARKWLNKYTEAAEKRGDLFNMAAGYCSLASLEESQGNPREAERLYLLSLDLFEGLGADAIVSTTRRMLGNLYVRMKLPDKARAEFTEALKIAKRLALKPDIAVCCEGLGGAYAWEGAFALARGWYAEALRLNKELGAKDRIARIQSKLKAMEEPKKTNDGKAEGILGKVGRLLKGRTRKK